MEDMLREILYKSIDRFGLSDIRTIKASKRLESILVKEQAEYGTN